MSCHSDGPASLVSVDTTVLRRDDGAIDYDAYRAKARALRRQAYRRAFDRLGLALAASLAGWKTWPRPQPKFGWRPR